MRFLESIRSRVGALIRLHGWVERIAVACALSAVLSAPLAQTVEPEPITSPRLGVPEVLSPMGSPLWIRIPVDATQAAISAAGSSFALGPRPANAGIAFIENAEISFEREGDKHFLVIRSRQPVNELAVGLVIREQLIRGVRSREFTVLLDPPVLFDAILAARAAEAARKAGSLLPKSLPQAPVIEPSPSARTSPRVRPAQSISPRRPVAAVTPVAPANAAVTTATAGVTPVERGRKQTVSDAGAKAKRTSPDKPLRLSLSAGALTVLPTANEATRNALRRRQLMLDTDNLMSALLERNHKITLLEKELAGLTARVLATERSLNIPIPPTATMPSKTTVAASNEVPPRLPAATALSPAPAPAPAVDDPVTTPAPTIAAAETPKPPPTLVPPVQVEVSWHPFAWWSITLTALVVLAIAAATLAIMRRREARDEPFAHAFEETDAPFSEVPAKAPTQAIVPASVDFAQEPFTAMVPPAPPVAEIPVAAFPEIHFELPEATADVPATSKNLHAPVEGLAGTPLQASSQAANLDAHPAPDDIRGRRTRYLQRRYQDIAILMPPLDAPQRLIKQASRIHDEGAVDYAKRLLKYSAYSRPYAEEFWLALLELLYREKFANDYLVNAKWFRQYLPDSANWDEVQRIGFLLDPAAPLFASAAAWSHEEPILGTWLPANQLSSEHASARPALKLELAS